MAGLTGPAAVLLLSIACLVGTGMAAEATETRHWIAVLQSNAPKQEKDAACRAAKRMGDKNWVPALAALLTDEELSHSARYALETIPGPEAGVALLQALEKTSGSLKAGVIHSLALRKEPAAGQPVLLLLASQDPHIAGAAAAASAQIRPAGTIDALESALAVQAGKDARRSIYDAMLAVAHQLLLENNTREASAIYLKLLKDPVPDDIRAAAYAGRIAAEEERVAVELLVNGIKGADGAARLGALQMAHQLRYHRATEEICRLIREAEDRGLQVALIAALAGRETETAKSTLIDMADADNEHVRIAAIKAMGEVGDAAAVAPLVLATTSINKEEQKEARQALLRLHGESVEDALVQQMKSPNARVRKESARVLVTRGTVGTSEKLLTLLRVNEPSVQKLALQTIGRLATAAEVPSLVEVVLSTDDKDVRTEAGSALEKAVGRLAEKDTPIDAGVISRSLETAGPQEAIALLPAVALIKDTELRNQVRQYLTTSTLPLRNAAVSALINARDMQYVPDVVAVARQSEDPRLQTLAVRAALRITTAQANAGDKVRQVELLKEIAPLATLPEEKWALLGGLSDAGGSEALKVALPLLSDKAAEAEATRAVSELVLSLPKAEGRVARPALQRILDKSTETATKEWAATALHYLDDTSITSATQALQSPP